MPRRLTAALFTLALFFGAITLSTAQTPTPAQSSLTVPYLELSAPLRLAEKSAENSLAFGCTYCECMDLCTEETATCHTVCSRDCVPDQIEIQ